MKKPLIVLAAASILALAACGGSETSSSGTSSEETGSSETTSETTSSSEGTSSSEPLTKIEPSVELAAAKIAALASGETDIIHYELQSRAYQDSYTTGEVMTNEFRTMEIHSYDGAFEGTQTDQQLSGIIATTVDSETSGRIAGYYLDEGRYAYGYNGDESHEADYYNIAEANRYQGPNVTERSLYSSFLAQVASGFDDIENIYPASYGYTISDPIIVEENGSFRITLGATAPEEGYYGHEENSIYCLLDVYTGEVVEIGTTMILFDMGYTDPDPEVSANNVTNNAMIIYETGERTSKDVDPIDVSVVPAEGYANTVPSKVADLETGDLSEDSVLAILSNIAAYAEGVTKDEFTVETSELTDLETYESLGAATGSGIATSDGETYEEEVTYTLEAGGQVVQSVKNTAGPDGITIEAGQNDSITSYEIAGEYVSSMASYFTPGPFTATTSTACSSYIISDAVNRGFGEFDDGINAGTQTLTSASNVDGTISIEFSSESTGLFGSSSITVSIEIVGGVLSTVDGHIEQTVTYGTYSSTTIATEHHVLTAA